MGLLAFFGVMLHVNRLVCSAAPSGAGTAPTNSVIASPGGTRLPLSCRLALLLVAVPVPVLGVYIPQPLHDLLKQAAKALTK